MPELRIEGSALTREARSREARFRIVSWGTVLLLLTVTIFLFILRACGRLNADSDLLSACASVCAFSFVGAIIGASLLASREALHRAEREMIFVLDDNGIVRKRKGYSDVKIAFSEIATLREELRWLVIKASEPPRIIAIPNNIIGCDAICAELAKRHPLSARAKGIEFPLKTGALLAVAILSWIAVVWFRDERAVVFFGAGGLITVAIGSYGVWTIMMSRPQLRRLRPLLWASLVSAWLMAILLIYLRLVHL